MSAGEFQMFDLEKWIEPARAAVLAIDMQVDFASPDGKLGAFIDMASVAPALKASERLCEAARVAGVPVVFLGLQTTPETDSKAWHERLVRLADPGADTALCRKGTRGADFMGPKPKPGEAIVYKTGYSGFYKTNMDDVLKALKVDTLVVCGITAECCVNATVWDAFHRDYHVFLPVDSCGAYEPEFHGPALKILEANCAILTDVDSVMAAWAK